VNRNNVGAIGAYERLGFLRTGEQVVDIGHGFVMDDYVYELVV
jgi:ribosomal protein S18 acetylase RimI-like enzyme